MILKTHMAARYHDKKGTDYTVELFKKLASIPSPSGKEKEVAKFITKELSEMGIPNYTDDSWRKNHSDTGNVIATLKGSGKCTVMFYAHMDTVAPNLTKPAIVESKGIIRSVNGAIMGADDKAGVAALISALRELKEKRHPTIIVAFTTKEEAAGWRGMGATFLSPRKKPDYTFVIDDKGRTGSFSPRALGIMYFTITFRGKGAHAASDPEKGINAIKAAALFINSLRLGRSKEGDCLNIGTVSGGTFSNVIPDNAVLTGEVRAFEYKRMIKQLAAVRNCAKKVCGSTGCSYVIKPDVRNAIPPLNSKDAHLVRIAKAAADKARIPFSSEDMYATCEANVLCRKGHRVIVMRPGYWNPHSAREYIAAKELVNCKRLVVAISETLSMMDKKA
jgi:tripeptide aminopeptidase